MANLALKKTVNEVVDNQLKSNDPPCTKETYNKLLDAGYSKSEAKDKIGAVVLTEIYDILKAGKPFDEAQYKKGLEVMLQQSIDSGENHYIRTEWDEWDELVQNGYDCFEEQKSDDGFKYWGEAWLKFQEIMGQQEQQAQAGSISALMEEQDYVYRIKDWLQNYGMELGNAEKHEERINFCQKVLELFDWRDEDDGCFRSGIGDSLFYEGKKAEARQYYEKWLAEDPQNSDGIIGFSWILIENGEIENAYELVRRVTWGVPCDLYNFILFMHAKQLAESIGKTEEMEWYQQQMDLYKQSELYNEGYMPKKIPVVKAVKIYPNDPCPCGSGKKYKKCCGKK